MKSYIDCNDNLAFLKFTASLELTLGSFINKAYDSIVFVCIGSDRSTGDSLGPLVGYKLTNIRYENVFIYGTLDNPVHAKNLAETIDVISFSHNKPLIVAIDACLGNSEHIGYICITDSPLKPGSGVNKNLPEIGEISITGIVNFGGIMDFLILQNTRLSSVMKIADLITLGIKHTLWKLNSIKGLPHQTVSSPSLITQDSQQ